MLYLYNHPWLHTSETLANVTSSMLWYFCASIVAFHTVLTSIAAFHLQTAMFPSFDKEYLPVGQRESIEDGQETPSKDFSLDTVTSTYPSWVNWGHWVLGILVLCLSISNLYTWTKLKASTTNNTVFCKSKITVSHCFTLIHFIAPAQSAIRYKNIAFTAGIDGDFSPYQGWPSKENDQLWEELFQCKWSSMPSKHMANFRIASWRQQNTNERSYSTGKSNNTHP